MEHMAVAGGGRWAQAGFTLLEVLVAVVVLALALGALIKVGSDNAANAAYLRDKTYAHWVALDQVVRYRVGLEPPYRGTREGVRQMAERAWHWRATLSEEDVQVEGIALAGLTRLTVEVRDRDHPDAAPLARVVGFLQ